MKSTLKINKAGDERWTLNGKLHREDGPAVETANGAKGYYLNGKNHREDGPAIEYNNGYKEYYLNDKKYSFEEWDRLRKMMWIL